MKLSEVTVTQKVPTGPPGDATARLHAKEGTGPAHGWKLDYDASTGCVYAEKGEQRLVIFPANLCFAVPAPVEAKKPTKAAA